MLILLYLDEKKTNLFEADIFLSRQDKYERGVDTSPTGDATGAKVDVESIGGEKRKGIRTRRKIWPSRIIPVAATRDMGEAMFFLGRFSITICAFKQPR